MVVGLIFYAEAIKCGSIKEKQMEKLTQYSNDNKTFICNNSRFYLRG